MRKKLITAGALLTVAFAAAWFGYQPLMTRLHRDQPPAVDVAAGTDPGDGSLTVARLSDKRAAVRRKALEALGPSRDACLDEDLLPLLHDPEADIRSRCEELLQARGLSDKEIQVGRLASDPSPLKRLQVIDRLPADADLDPEAWLERLSHDPSPAVRIGAARAAMDPTSPLGVNLTERVREMAQRDPDGTVRQIADYLIRTRNSQ